MARIIPDECRRLWVRGSQPLPNGLVRLPSPSAKKVVKYVVVSETNGRKNREVLDVALLWRLMRSVFGTKMMPFLCSQFAQYIQRDAEPHSTSIGPHPLIDSLS